MRIVAESSRGACKITVFSWSSKYILKFELAGLEQTFKFTDEDLNDAAVQAILDDEAFVSGILERFAQMSAAFADAYALRLRAKA